MIDTTMVAYKGFNNDWTCRDLQYEVGKSYEHIGEVKACRSGFHACENPLDVFEYYSPASSKYAVVQLSGERETEESGSDTKVAATKILIEKELSLSRMVTLGVEYILRRSNNTVTNTEYKSTATNTGDRSTATNTGDRSAATNTGDRSAATNNGYKSAATNMGDNSVATNMGDNSVATNTGNNSAATNKGHKSAVTNMGHFSVATNMGHFSVATNMGDNSAAINTGAMGAATNTGDNSAANAAGTDSIALVSGYSSKAKACEGSAICLVERNINYEILNVYAGIAGKDIKPDVFYTLVDGRPVECED